MAEGFITEAAMALLTTVLSRAAEEVKLPWTFKHDKKDLEQKLKRIQLLLCGASTKSFDNPLADDWLRKVKYVAYEADDLLDELAYEALKQRLKFNNHSQFKRKLGFFFTLHSNPVVLSFQMGHRMRDLMGSIEDVYKDAQLLGIKPVDFAAGPCRSVPVVQDVQLQVRRELVTGHGLVGRDKDEANVIRMLCHPKNSDRDVNVVGIVGMAGLGKTALAKRVFDSDEVGQHFAKKIWVCVSHDFELKAVFAKMVELLDGEPSNQATYQATITKLETKLKGQRYLLVLDDVWDTIINVWESITSVLLDIGGSKGTVVLATSRSSHVIATLTIDNVDQALTTQNEPLTYPLKGLNSVDAWYLFQRRVRHIIDVDRAKKMVAKCGGIPLAINVLGDLLRNRCLEEWREIEESKLWKLDDKYGILPSLRLSFNYLPSAAIKNCFAYCAIFPEDSIIKRECLIQLWMAQGFLQPYDKMEYIGNEYFNILMNNSFFQDVLFDKDDNISSCKMHDTVHALAKVVAREMCLILSENSNMTNISSDVRHISVLTEKALPLKLMKLRTLISTSVHIGIRSNLVTHAKSLRVLSLVDAGLSKLPDSIGCFKHLRYLDISGNYILNLPPAVGELYNLQTLRHFHTGFRCQSTFPTLPKELGKLVDLRTIYINNELFSSGLSLIMVLKAQRSSRGHDCDDKWGGSLSDINSLNNIRGSLAIWNLEHVLSKDEERQANLRSKPNIHQLDLTWSYNANCITNCEEVLEELQPHDNLKILSIWYYNGKTLPSWLLEISSSRMPQFCNLVEIKFYYCFNLNQLPGSLVFPFLKVFVVWGCHNLTSFPELDNMNSLEILEVGRCPLLEDFPSLESLTNLHRLEIHNCARMTSLPLGLASCCNLTELEMGPLCRDLDIFPFPDISRSCPLSKSLKKLCLRGWSKVKKLPDQLEHFTQLQTLSICHFASLKTLPSWLRNLTCLEIVILQHMENLTSLPSCIDMQRPKRSFGYIIGPYQCPKLDMFKVHMGWA